MIQSTKGAEAPIILAGCAPDSGNLGVVALAYSMALGLAERLPNQPVMLIGFGGDRIHTINDHGIARKFEVLGLNHSRRFYSPNATSNLDVLLKLKLPFSKIARAFKKARLLIDISAGDSFSDIYGAHRYDGVCYPKEKMLGMGKPLILLPQTYGPFATAPAKERASRLVRQSMACWARDVDSYKVLQELLGSEFDASRHRQGVDVAFLLPIREPTASVVQEFRAKQSEVGKWIGFNVSGLVHNDPVASTKEFGLKADYRDAVHQIANRLLADSSHSLVLVSHVADGSGRDSDPPAARAVYEQLTPQQRERVWVAPAFSDPREIKWLISQCDWFCGTRMHATIAGLSSGVPTASIAYSMKTRGVFESCGVADQVIDPRHLDTEEVIERTVQSFHDRESTRKRLAEALPATLAIAKQQMDEIAELCRK